MSDQATTDGETEDDEPEAQPIYFDQGPDREEMAANYMPGSEDWRAKTILDLNDPAAVAALSQFGDMFPEVDDLQPVIDEFLHDFLRSRTSVKGKSREEYKDILMSMFGGKSDPDAASTLAYALGAEDDD